MMQKLDFYKMTEATGLPGGAFLLIFVTTMKILVINILISLLNETLSAMKMEREMWAKDTEVMDHLKHIIVSMITGEGSERQDTYGMLVFA